MLFVDKNILNEIIVIFLRCTVHMPCTFFLIMYSNHCDKISDMYKIIYNIDSHKIYTSLQY